MLQPGRPPEGRPAENTDQAADSPDGRVAPDTVVFRTRSHGGGTATGDPRPRHGAAVGAKRPVLPFFHILP
ncbi:hypothetical protein NOSIN_05685 [Nocardiopsis sinuspersici]|uniref:Uncharacterized protein n=1 Tax=Nocardiopsis sinuspersici TaxID=501010 RepID=A0A1V3BYD0_9ACTN|nr:hypothetical protein NOSIN_05685 [Nocardiopsis sinuspersici]